MDLLKFEKLRKAEQDQKEAEKRERARKVCYCHLICIILMSSYANLIDRLDSYVARLYVIHLLLLADQSPPMMMQYVCYTSP